MITAKFHPLFTLFLVTSSILAAPAASGATDAAPVAGLAPNQRPVGAPKITAAPAYDTPNGRALHGVSQPTPPSLGFLRDQGNWHTPFDQPGMPGPYDIRGWYSNPPAARK